MSKYPYIGKSRLTPTLALFTAPSCGYYLGTGDFSGSWNERFFDDVTSEYLSCKKIKVKSPAESKLVQLAVFKADGETRTGGKNPINLNAPFILINKDLKVTFEDDRSFFDAYEMDFIKLPRFDNPPEFVFTELERPIKHFDCVCVKCGGRCCVGNCDEWPKVGDDVLIFDLESDSRNIDFNNEKAKVIAKTKNSRGVVLTISHNLKGIGAIMLKPNHIKKPKTPEEELRDDIIDIANLKHPAGIAYDLMAKYNITKNVKDND